MNKQATKKQREGALKKLLETMIEKTKSMGFKIIMCLGTEEQNNTSPILSRFRKQNADIVVQNLSQYYKVIN